MNNPTARDAATGAAASRINAGEAEGDRLLELKTALAGKYEVQTRLGASESRESYLARDKQAPDERFVVLQVLSALAADDPTERKLFYLESSSASELVHPNIAVTTEAEEIGGFYCYSVDHRPGFKSLRSLIDSQGWLSVDQAGSIAYQVAEALRHAHEAGVLHLNLCPERVMIGPQGQVIVTGFGVYGDHRFDWAHRRRSGDLRAHYLSPEQAGNSSVDGRSDLYSLGVLIFEMTTDRVPFESDDGELIKRKHIAQVPQPPRVFRQWLPDWVSAVVMALLAKDPDERCKSADYLCTLLRRFTRDASAAEEARSLPATRPTRRGQVKPTSSEIEVLEDSRSILELEDIELLEPQLGSVSRQAEYDSDPFYEGEHGIPIYREEFDPDGGLNPARVDSRKSVREAFEIPTITAINAPPIERQIAEPSRRSEAQPLPRVEQRASRRWPLLILIAAVVVPATILASKDIRLRPTAYGVSSRVAGAEADAPGSPGQTTPTASTGAAPESGKRDGVAGLERQPWLQKAEPARAQLLPRPQVRRRKAPVSRTQARRAFRPSPGKAGSRGLRTTKDQRLRPQIEQRGYRRVRQ